MFPPFSSLLPSLETKFRPTTTKCTSQGSSCAQTEPRPPWPRHSPSLNKHWALTPPPLSHSKQSTLSLSSSTLAPDSPQAMETMEQ